ncbi:hypothetical protein C8R47DRAFT_1313036 [Mycena vitilis]|nr:hypothetical protein C8R47DRAFT_1313036 [Mycena vitilis]
MIMMPVTRDRNLLRPAFEFAFLRGLFTSDQSSTTISLCEPNTPTTFLATDSGKATEMRADRADSNLPYFASESRSPRLMAQGDITIQLPAELLVEIFGLCYPLGEGIFAGLSDTTTPAQEVERLAKRYLLQLSQVCARWHILVVGTPMLWRTIIVDTTLWSQSNTKPATLLELLSVSLDRVGSYPLTVRVAVEDEASHGTQVLELLSQHSHRWQVAHFWTGFQSFQSVASARGKLPLLEKLEISQNDDWDEFDVFEVAPRLTRFTVTGWGTRVPTVPWSQWLSYQSFEPNLLAEGLSLLREDFPANNRCDLTMNALDIVDINLPSIVSNVASFILTLEVDVLREPPVEVLGLILASLTLPCLDTMGLMGKAGEPPLSWHQQHFLAFA